MPPQRQTMSYLRNLFARRGIAPQHRYGQNFLIDLNIHELIARAAEIGPEDVILEIGPGAGALTALMAESASAVVAVEIDPGMARLTREATGGRMNVRVLNMDALASKHAINPEVLDNVRAGLAVAPDRRFKLVANLPYNIATPIITNLLVSPDLCPSPDGGDDPARTRREAPRRARSPTPTAGCRSSCNRLPTSRSSAPCRRRSSGPSPKVESAVVKITPNGPRNAPAIADLPWFHSRSSAASSSTAARTSAASSTPPGAGRWTKPEVDAMLESASASPAWSAPRR